MLFGETNPMSHDPTGLQEVLTSPVGESAQPVLALDECVAALAAEAGAPDTAGGTDTPMR